MVKIITDYGFCFGVNQAIEKLIETGKMHSRVYLTHPLIHNVMENERLMNLAHASFFEKGLTLTSYDAVILSAHGHTLEQENQFKGLCHLVDATCPLILQRYLKVHPYEEGISYIYLGKKNHQETLGFLSHFPYFTLVDSTLDLNKQLEALFLEEKCVFIPQTTVSKDSWNMVKTYLEEHTHLLQVMDICPLYEKRSKQAITVIKDLDPERNYFIVCGDKTSSNAKEIYHAMSLSNPKLKGTIALDSSMLNLNELKGKDIYIASATSVNKDTVEKLKQDLELAI